MVSKNCPRLWSFDWDLAQYREIKWKAGVEPRKRSLPLVASFAKSRWRVTITFEGSLHSDKAARANRKQRRMDLQNLCLCLDFDRLKLVDNTVTELLIKREHDDTPPAYENDITSPDGVLPLTTTPHVGSEYFFVFNELRLCVREDPFRVQFPAIDCNAHTITELSAITTIRQLSAGVHEVHVGSGRQSYVYKQVDKPLYEPRDSEVLSQELRNLQLFHGTKGIVQLVAAVVSCNPYYTFRETAAYEAFEAYDSDQSAGSNETHQSDQNTNAAPSTVLRGVLLEYHPNGTLADALQSSRETPQMTGTWRRWALQIVEALSRVHKQQITHMDLKPSNILISAENDAVLSDVSGIGGVTRNYLAPEMLDVPDPLAEGLEARTWNDIWALGKMILEMGDATSNEIEKEQLWRIARVAMADEPSSRPSLHQIVSLFLSNQAS